MSNPGDPRARLLVIDDEQIVHESVQRILEAEGFVVESALRVDEALEKLRKGSYDVVLTDLMMPDRDGMDAIRAIADGHPDTGVIMFTGFSSVDSVVISMKLGALDYLPKPFTPDELLEAVESAIEKTRKARRDKEIEETYAEAEKALTSSLDLQEILNLICTSVVRLFQVKGCAVLMIHQKDQSLAMTASSGLSEEFVEKGFMEPTKSVPAALESGEPVTIEASEFDSQLQFPDAARREGIVSIQSIPLKLKGAVLGFLRVYRTEACRSGEEEQDLILKFGEQAAKAVENAMSYDRVRKDIDDLKKGIPGAVADKMGT